jgi:hypothetical protein
LPCFFVMCWLTSFTKLFLLFGLQLLELLDFSLNLCLFFALNLLEHFLYFVIIQFIEKRGARSIEHAALL